MTFDLRVNRYQLLRKMEEKMGFQKVADIQEFDNIDKKLIELDEKKILLTKVAGGYYAISNKCPHMGGSLYKGTLQDGVITCPRHGAKYDAKTGKGLGKPKILFFEFKMEDDRSFPVKVEDGDILIDINPA
ncbi:Rieske 2Fe-2S domain-containing protein [Acetobacterium malicum]|uniref:Rieske 2Fe-2S domain-containing protein n=2 Tax=Acetobacterium malicum TaxID=52692 RepID=A0ABR6YT43_9FIRM|nr:Rieske 2Fe-2S domain-containing protein [Acetobacterium malicum]